MTVVIKKNVDSKESKTKHHLWLILIQLTDFESSKMTKAFPTQIKAMNLILQISSYNY